MPNLISPYIVDDCPLCGLQVTSLSMGISKPLCTLSPCGHSVNASSQQGPDGNIRIELSADPADQYIGLPYGGSATLQKFVWRLSGLSYSFGWMVSFTTGLSDTLMIYWSCPHGWCTTEGVSGLAIVQVQDPGAFADATFAQVRLKCASEHAMYAVTSYTNQFIPASTYTGYVGVGGVSNSSAGDLGGGTLSFLARVCPIILSHSEQCPEQPCTLYRDAPIPLSSLIQHINDLHKWSRGKVAAWLDTLDVDLTIDMEGAKNAFAGTSQAPALQAGEPF